MLDIIPNNLWAQDIFFKRITSVDPICSYSIYHLWCAAVSFAHWWFTRKGRGFLLPSCSFCELTWSSPLLASFVDPFVWYWVQKKKTIINQIYQFRSSVNVYPFYFRNIATGSAFGCIYILWVMCCFTGTGQRGAHPTCCQLTLDTLHVGYCNLPHRW